MMQRLFSITAILVLTCTSAIAADASRAAIIATFAAEALKGDKTFAGFSGKRGEAVFRTVWAGGDSRTPSCTSCHTTDPSASGKNAKTGRPIDPMAVSKNPQRFTNMGDVEKHFTRDCKSVLGRPCTALEKGDYVTFMGEQ